MRNVGLDILRAIALILVLGRHLGSHFTLPPDLPFIIKIWQQGGWVGVDIFFVLSGYLISSLLFKELKRTGTVNVKRFLIRRGFKLYPAFWLFITFSVVIRVFLRDPISIKSLLGELLFLQNYLGQAWNHTWSLAVEEHFYIGIAILLSYLTSTRFSSYIDGVQRVPFVFAIIGITCLTLRIITMFVFPEFSYKFYVFATHVRIDSLFYGVLLSYLCHFRDLEKKISWIPSWLLYLSGCILLSPAFIFQLETTRWLSVVGVILFFVGSGNILLAIMRVNTSNLLGIFKLIGSLGATSYSIYLWHMPVEKWGCSLLRSLTGIEDFSALLDRGMIYRSSDIFID
jgi:peptidoglycan/LPS O-acetylase OafA/YrhL